jgi:hypothetical protein
VIWLLHEIENGGNTMKNINVRILCAEAKSLDIQIGF